MSAVRRARGGWWHDFVCPTHGTELLEARGEVFVCTYGCELQGEPFASAWLVLEHQSAARDARVAAHRFRRDGDPADRASAVEVVRDFADYYAEITAEWNSDSESWMLQGKLFKQALTEAIWATQIADAVLVLADDPTARESMGAPVASMLVALLDTIVEARRVLVVERDDLMSNYVAWLDAAGSLLTRALAALDSPVAAGGHEGWVANVAGHSAVAIRADGWEWEGSTYYHLFVLRAYLLALGGSDPASLDRVFVERLHRMVAVLVDVAAADGRLPMLHDGPYDRVGVHLEVLEICALARQLWDSTGLDTVEAWARSRVGDTHDGLEDLLEEWFDGPPLATAPPVDSSERTSVLFADVGFAVLRSGGTTMQAVLDAGPHGGSHGHLDTLALYLYSDGVAWQPAPGVPPYGSALRRGHYARTTAHPTIRVDDADQSESSGRVDQWSVGTGSTLIRASSSEAIDGVDLERRVEAVDGLLIDVFRATAADGSARRFTSALRPAVPFEVVQDGATWRTRWAGPLGRKLHGHHVADVPSDLVDAPGRGPSDDPTVPLAVGDWTAEAPRVTFVSVFAEGDLSPIGSVSLDGGRLIVRLNDGRSLERMLSPELPS